MTRTSGSMKLSAGLKRLLGAVVVFFGLLGLAARVDVPRLSGKIKGDEATYVAMALSLAKDHDLKYRSEDYQRFMKSYGSGPEGIFLKRRSGPDGSADTFEFGKAFAYAVAAAP